MDWQLVKAEFNTLVSELEDDVEIDFDSIIAPSTTETDAYAEVLEKARGYASRLNIDLESASQGHGFVNGKHFDMNDVRVFYVRHMLLVNISCRISFVTCSWKPANSCSTYKKRYVLYHSRVLVWLTYSLIGLPRPDLG